MLQVFSLVAMEKPAGRDPESIRDAKVNLLRHVKPITLEDSLLGQYVANNGKPGYKDDDTVPKDSICPTFATLVLWIENERWKKVPFILKAGKGLDNAKAEVRIQFKDTPKGSLFEGAVRNELVLRIQPGEAIYFKFNNKNPGLSQQIITTDLDLTYKDRYKDMRGKNKNIIRIKYSIFYLEEKSYLHIKILIYAFFYIVPDAYEGLILDVLRSDHSNFVRDDELDAAWRIFTPLLHKIERDRVQPKPYPYGSRGPKELDDFIKKYGVVRRSDVPYQWPVQSVAK